MIECHDLECGWIRHGMKVHACVLIDCHDVAMDSHGVEVGATGAQEVLGFLPYLSP